MRVTVTARIGDRIVLTGSEIESLEVQQEVGSHHLCFLSFYRDTALERVSLEELLGKPVVVTLTDEGGASTAFEGELSSGSQSHLTHQASYFVIEAVSLSARMQLHRNTAYFPESTLADVTSALGATLVGGAGGPRLDYVQHGESDFDFLVRIADDQGCLVRPTPSGAEVRCGFAETGHELAWGTNLFALTSHCRPVNHGFKGAAYQVSDKRDHRFHGVRKAPATTGGAAALVSAARQMASKVGGGGDPNVDEVASRVPRIAECKVALERESVRALGSSVLVEGASSHVGLTAGDTVSIVPGANWELPVIGTFGLVRVTHRFDGQQYGNEFTATPWATYTSARRPVRRTMEGCVTAEVTANEDPKKLGRVRVRYRWQDKGKQTGWIRVAVAHGGNGRGTIFTPEVGDEVLVGFEHGDPERPYVLGSLWNGKDLAPQIPEVKRIITRSGNTIQMTDTAGKEVVEIFSAEGKCLLQLASDVGGTPTLTIHSEGDVSIEAKGEIRLSCARLVEKVSGDAAREVGGDATLKVSGKLTEKAGGDVAVAAGMNAAVTAGMNLDAFGGALTRVVGSMVHLNPPGAVAPRVQASIPSTPDSVWSKKAVPSPSQGTSTADAPTPRTRG
ncbi:MAG TPA: phage baseplate assembly protein V [Longimicrobiaceae bacterium]|nr:phage baseplate assembly protein V [Longimicrobiaceae bacterium]